jgi:predicted RNA binding protein YcfA (HicA-like mRNA interferase family)
MPRIGKLTEKFLQNPKSLRYRHLEKVLIHLGFMKITAKGSHIKFKHVKLNNDLIIPVHNNDCKNFYKELAKKLVIANNLHKP